MTTKQKVIGAVIALVGLIAIGAVALMALLAGGAVVLTTLLALVGGGWWYLGGSIEPEATSAPTEIRVMKITVADDITVDSTRPLHPLLEARPEVGALAAYASATGANFRQMDERGAWTRLERTYWLPESEIKRVDPEWSKGDKRERVVITGVVPAFEVSGEEPERRVNDYAVTAELVDGKHRAVSTACVNAALLGLTPPDSCPKQVKVECDDEKPGACSLMKLGAKVKAKATLSPESEATEEITTKDLMQVLLKILAAVEAKKGS